MEQEKTPQEKIEQLNSSYRHIFGGAIGQDVLEDLYRECGLYDPIGNETGSDPYRAYWLLGRRDIALYIKRRLEQKQMNIQTEAEKG